MAWTSLGDRFPEPPAREQENASLGPGTYLGHVERTAEPQYAPFGSSKPRENPEKHLNITGPAPGAYDPKLPNTYDPGLPKRHVPFTTGAPRLSPSQIKEVPGPGAYEVTPKLAEALSCRTMGLPAGDKRSMFKSTSAPSIPQAHQSHGYEETEDGRLVRQESRMGEPVRLSGRHGDSAGPGHYDCRQRAMAKRPTQGRFLPGNAQSQATGTGFGTPGPGHYDAKLRRQPSVSSIFVSQSDRLKSGSESSLMPGPGQYESGRPARPSLQAQRADMQFFGSTSERFKATVDDRPGPGSYQLRQSQTNKSSWIKSNRFQEPHAAELPGPGEYNTPQDLKTNSSASLLGSAGNAAFGSGQMRLPNSFKESVPGPGSYSATEVQMGEDNVGLRVPNRKAPKLPSAVFRSETPAICMLQQTIKEGTQGPPPGAYNPIIAGDTGTVMRQPPKGEGFLSAGPRDAMSLRDRAPGPGRYDAPLEVGAGKRKGSFNRTVVEGAPSNGRLKSLGFNVQAQRFRSTSVPIPGPGTYKTDPTWISKSHNKLHFSKDDG